MSHAGTAGCIVLLFIDPGFRSEIVLTVSQQALPLNQQIEIVECHAEGEVGDVIVAGVEPPPGETLWEQSRWIARDETLRRFVLNEPRGGVFRHVNLLVPAVNPEADLGFIIMEPADTPPMSGSNAMCVATVALETGILTIKEPETRLVLEAPGGLVSVTAACDQGKVQRVKLQNNPSFVSQLDASIQVPDLGKLDVDVAYGGDSFVLVDATSLGFELVPHEARRLAQLGVAITRAANDQLGFVHPTNAQWRHISFCLFTTPVVEESDGLTTRHACAIRPGKIDRSPTGTGVSARLAVLGARGLIAPGQKLRAHSIIDSTFVGQIQSNAQLGEVEAIIPTIEGRAFTTGSKKLWLTPGDPWPEGYRVADTWPVEE